MSRSFCDLDQIQARVQRWRLERIFYTSGAIATSSRTGALLLMDSRMIRRVEHRLVRIIQAIGRTRGETAPDLERFA